MSKKLVYVGLLLPLVCSAQDQEAPVAELSSQTDEQEVKQEVAGQEPQREGVDGAELDEVEGDQDLDQDTDLETEDDTDDEDDASASDIDLTESPEYARGNWYEKQQTLKQAHDVYQEVRQKEAGVAQFESIFITKKNELTNKFEEFSQSLAVSLPVLHKAIVDELEKLEKIAKPSAGLTQEERIKLTEAQETKNVLTQLKKDLDAITELYKAADQAMIVLMQQITATHNFEQKAFESYEKIAQVLSDQVAKQLYAEIVAARENIAGIAEYIKGDFSRYFDELSENITKSITLVHQQLATLKEHGLDLTKSQEEKVVQHEECAAPAPKPTRSYFSMFFSGFYAFWFALANYFAGIWRWFAGFFA
ncbi:MAG: hypothetical protein ACHP65_09430 [Legionellales bacterium]